MKRFDIQNMASGGLSLVLEPKAEWEQFPQYAEHWVTELDAQTLADAVVTADECLLEVLVRGGRFWITYDDFQASIHLEPQDKNTMPSSWRSKQSCERPLNRV